ncbi:helix-turn-helix domain-containing protein [Pseudoflavonifractor phocaeensis]|uniref:helix-turn-helix domain-containing protein n=1 Tax=Pseudoflavonifractor phocaeensis TaxID=1870988 RepID=UPI0019570897|nr:helix-turn-helix transcriptional regulator [Pseudoflavonifractor phocaeensis]MBM6871351.1 helix-turn-helix transcriptional regulator [Pseudoflavonifractor phocaeensis]
MEEMSTRLLALRKERNLKQTEVAEALGLSISSYCRYEYGQREPTVSVLIRMADFYGVSMDYLAGRNDVR